MYQPSYLPQQYVPQQDLRTSQRVNEYNEEAEGLLYQQTPLHKCTSWLVHLCPFIFLLVVLIVSCVLFHRVRSDETTNAKEANSVLADYYKDLHAAPIRSISLKPSAEIDANNCPAGHTAETIFNYPIINSGCLCNDGTTHVRAYCWTHDTCTYVHSRTFTPFQNYKKSKVCVQRLASDQFVLKPSSTESCPTGFSKACGTNLCLKDALTTPEYTVWKNILTSTEAGDSNFEQTTTGKIKFDTVSCATPLSAADNTFNDLIGLKVGVTEKPCSTWRRLGAAKFYPLSKIPFNGCGVYGTKTYADKSLAAIASSNSEQTTREFFSSNKFLTAPVSPATVYSEVDGLPKFNTFLDDTNKVDLYKISRPPVGNDKACRSVGTKLFADNDQFQSLLKIVYGLSLANIVLCSLGLLLTLLYLCGNNLKCCQYYPFRGPKLYYVILIICLAVAVICIVQAAYHWNKQAEVDLEEGREAYINSLVAKECFSQLDNVKKAANDLASFHSTSDSSLYPGILFLFIWAIVWLVLWVVCYFTRKFILKDLVVRRPGDGSQ